MMKDLVEKLREAEDEIVREKGPFSFFALIQASDDLPFWDVVVSAPWIGRDIKAAISLVVEKLNRKFTSAELSSIASIAVVDENQPLIQVYRKLLGPVSGGGIELLNSSMGGQKLPDAYLITTRPIPRPASAIAATPIGG